MTTINVKATSDLTEIIIRALDAGEIPFLEGVPGIGKSAITKAVAAALNLLFIDIRLTGMDQTDINGVMNFVDVYNDSGDVIGKRTKYIPNDRFPLEKLDDHLLLKRDSKGNLIGEKYDGFLLMLDEFADASDEVRSACYQLLHDRMIGEYKLHPLTDIVCASNGVDDGALASEIGTALRTRVLTVKVDVDYKGWMSWANKNGIDQRIISYLTWKPSNLHVFDPRNTTDPFPSNRTWEKVSNILAVSNTYDSIAHTLSLGAIGKLAAEFKAFIECYSKLPSIKAILADPANADMPTEIGQVYALSGVVAQAFLDNIDNAGKVDDLFTYLNRMGKEYQVVTMANAVRKSRKLILNPSAKTWLKQHGAALQAQV